MAQNGEDKSKSQNVEGIEVLPKKLSNPPKMAGKFSGKMDFDKRIFSNFRKDGNMDEKASQSGIPMTGKEIITRVMVTSASGE